MSGSQSRLDEMVARTPATRDRYVDSLRAASICAVLFGHWFIGLIYWKAGVVGVHSAVGVTSLTSIVACSIFRGQAVEWY